MKFLYFLFIVLLLAAGQARGQSSIKSLQEQIRKAEQEIKINTELLNKNKKDQQLSQSQLKLIQSRINNRREIIASLEEQIALLDEDITTKSTTVEQLNQNLAQLKGEYASMIRSAYKNYRMNDFLLFLFAAEDFNDATRRIDFMRRYNRMREQKAEQITQLADSISREVNELNTQKQELDKARQTRSSELQTLGSEETQYRNNVSSLKSQESKINRELKAKRDQIAKAQKRIEEIVAEEARKNRNEKRTAAEDKYITELSGKFDENKGKLPYPLRGGVIIDRYGTHAHPTQPGLIVNNKGINIAGSRGAEVTCIFEGTVSKIFSLPGLNNCVMVRHGNYITLYANLASVAVKNGEKLSLNQRVGRIADSANNDDNYVHFEIWRETTNLNPEQWLRR